MKSSPPTHPALSPISLCTDGRTSLSPPQIIATTDHCAYLQESTLHVNEGSSKLGVHRDPHTPYPALLAGPTVFSCVDGEWQRHARGGRLFLADGLFDLSYGPRDVVLMDGNVAHGVTNLRDLPNGHVKGRRELERFSMIVFARFHREKVQKAGNYSQEWRPEWESGLL